MKTSRLPAPRVRHPIDSSLAIVNIVLLLIFFFLTTGSLLNSRSIEVALPETTRLPLDLLPQPLLTVSADGGMTLDGDPIDSGTLAAALIDSPRVNVLTDQGLSATFLLETLAAENLVAVEVRLVTLHRETGDAP
ncbi:MAG: ExbD/TolR family protein [Marivita sp.]|uniref:ExbD/TolR family protein n=1 Tax=Marivita sp. TaxID=2003365 RepID=UPI003EF94E1F